MWRVAIAVAACACHAHLGDSHPDARAAGDGAGAIDAMPDAPSCFNGRVVFLEFEGVQLTQGPSDATTNHAVWLGVAQATIPPFQQNATGRNGLISQITSKVTSGLAQFPITVVTTRPITTPYVMVAFGGTPQTVNVPFIDAVANLDCGDVDKSDVALVFDTVSPATTQKYADYAIGAIAYGLGLTGTQDVGDCMCGWNTSCQQNAGPCTLSPSITAAIACAGQTNPQDEPAAFRAAFCQ